MHKLDEPSLISPRTRDHDQDHAARNSARNPHALNAALSTTPFLETLKPHPLASQTEIYGADRC
jgi:hypothetical protein